MSFASFDHTSESQYTWILLFFVQAVNRFFAVVTVRVRVDLCAAEVLVSQELLDHTHRSFTHQSAREGVTQKVRVYLSGD